MVTIKLGLNLSRKSEEEKKYINIYTNNDLINDLDTIDYEEGQDNRVEENNAIIHTVHRGDLVYSFINSISGIVGKANGGKIINQNFAKIEIDENRIDKKYLCYLLNSDKEINREKDIAMQGSVLKKLSPTAIRNFEVELPDIDRQKKIGNLYATWIRRKALIKKRNELEDIIFSEFLNDLKMQH
ncbi:type I restriction modification system protein HsdIA [Enterococcus devriesei]|uniref:Type I restriction modification system protein HsdIA n=1 Tax=Enterococcus devriesei TaxID=319970 RepID=A0A1L8SPP0_9ENTE|nr:type I restriction modification system protein HsdIA [Enterococcus devriesei]